MINQLLINLLLVQPKPPVFQANIQNFTTKRQEINNIKTKMINKLVYVL